MIITVTLNPAMDKVLVVDQFNLNVTNRIQRQFNCVGGKGTHISINLSLMGIRNTAVGVVMGPTGDEILEALGSMNIDVRFIRLEEGNSRTNYVLVDNSKNCTLIAEKGKLMDEDVIERLKQLYQSIIKKGDIVVISGDASNQRNTNLQKELMDIAKDRGAKVCLDASGEHLYQGVRNGPFLIKPNLDELSTLYGKEIHNVQDILMAMDILKDFGIENIVVSCGGEGSFAYSEGKYYHVAAPRVEVKNTVGCGDALLSGLLAGLERKLPMQENLRQATAVAAATAMNEATVGFDVKTADKLIKEIEVEIIQVN